MVVGTTNKRSRDDGFALLLALFVLILAAAALSILAAHIELQLKEVDQQKVRLNLIAINDSTLAETLALLSKSPGVPGIPRRQIPGGWTQSQVKKVTSKRYNVEVRVSYQSRHFGSTTQVYFQKEDNKKVPELKWWHTGIEG